MERDASIEWKWHCGTERTAPPCVTMTTTTVPSAPPGLVADIPRLVPSAAADGLSLQVVDKQMVADGVCAITLAHPDGFRLPDWAPGSHIDVILPGELVRQYSLCGDRWDPFRYRIAVLREPSGRGGSAYVHDSLDVGDVLPIGGPRNNFALVPSAHYLFIAGGIGITPIIPMTRQADLLGTDWSMLYGGRTRSSMAFADELAADSRVRVLPQDQHGLLELDEALAATPADTTIYCCGPAPLLEAVTAAAKRYRPGRLRIERFVAAELPAPARTCDFDVHLARSGTTVTVAPDQSVLEAINAAGVPMLSSCRQGICGTCEADVLEGVPDHRDSLLTDTERAENSCMFVCVSRSRSDRLVLDL